MPETAISINIANNEFMRKFREFFQRKSFVSCSDFTKSDDVGGFIDRSLVKYHFKISRMSKSAKSGQNDGFKIDFDVKSTETCILTVILGLFTNISR